MSGFTIRSHMHSNVKVYTSSVVTVTPERRSEIDAIHFCNERGFKLKGSKLWTDTVGHAWIMDDWGKLLPVPNVVFDNIRKHGRAVTL